MASFEQILQKYRDTAFSERDKGYRFERLMQSFLKTYPLYEGKFASIWLIYNLQDENSLVLQNVIGAIQVTGYLKYFNQIDSIELYFDGLEVNSFSSLQGNDIQFDVNNYLVKINARSINKKRNITLDEIMDFKQRYCTNDLLNLCNGHDVISLITFIINNKISDNVSHKAFCTVLIAAFNIHYFQKTKLYNNILSWQIYHGLSVFRA